MTAAATKRRADLASGVVALWVVFWLVVGVWTGYELWQLSQLGATVADSGQALDAAGSALQSLVDVPVVGDSTAELGGEVREAATDIVGGALEAQETTRRLSVLLGLTIALVPSLPVLALFLLLRRGLLIAPER